MHLECATEARDLATAAQAPPRDLAVDAWCHLRNELRSFGQGSLRAVVLGDDIAGEVSDAELGKVLDPGYGIFPGKDVQWAELVFSSERVRWVSQETWHAEQESWVDEAGR